MGLVAVELVFPIIGGKIQGRGTSASAYPLHCCDIATMPTNPINPLMYLEDVEVYIRYATDPELEPDYDDDPPTMEMLVAAAFALQQKLKKAQHDLTSARAALQREYGEDTTPGGELLLSTDQGGLRFCLKGVPLYAGEAVFLLTRAGWLPGRFDYARTKEGSVPGHFHFSVPGAPNYSGEVSIPVPTGARLARPGDIKGRR